jgi:acyl transferase domain-containing protein
MKTVFMFSGQGSQHYHMGKALFAQERVFRETLLRLDARVRDLCGRSVVDSLYDERNAKGTPFDDIVLTHPAIFMIEYSLAECLSQAGVRPDMTLGASLGTFAAAAVAGLIRAEDALTAIVQQAQVLERSCDRGGMYAVLADPEIYGSDCLGGHSELAGVNFASHFVVSARQQSFATIEAQLRQRQIAFQRLPVSFAFHSQWIDGARPAFESLTQHIRTGTARIPFMCCERADFVDALPENYFWRIVRKPIRFQDAVRRLERDGSYRYIDVGPASTLATFLKYGLPGSSRSTIAAILSPYGHDQRNYAAVVGMSLH